MEAAGGGAQRLHAPPSICISRRHWPPSAAACNQPVHTCARRSWMREAMSPSPVCVRCKQWSGGRPVRAGPGQAAPARHGKTGSRPRLPHTPRACLQPLGESGDGRVPKAAQPCVSKPAKQGSTQFECHCRLLLQRSPSPFSLLPWRRPAHRSSSSRMRSSSSMRRSCEGGGGRGTVNREQRCTRSCTVHWSPCIVHSPPRGAAPRPARHPGSLPGRSPRSIDSASRA